jgi:hypothetical protein
LSALRLIGFLPPKKIGSAEDFGSEEKVGQRSRITRPRSFYIDYVDAGG